MLDYFDAGGTRRRLTLGRPGEMSLAQARDRASSELAAIRAGQPDMAERRRKAVAAPTVAALVDQFLAVEGPARIERRRMTERTLAGYRHQCGKYLLPALGNLRVADVRRGHIERMVAPLPSTTRNRVLALASRLMTLAEVWELRPQHTNPVRKIERAREIVRDRVLTGDEMARLAGALADTEADKPVAVAAIRFLAVTGLRVGEALAIQWAHVDMATGRLLIPRIEDREEMARSADACRPDIGRLAPDWSVGLHLYRARTDRLQDRPQGVSRCLRASRNPGRAHPRSPPRRDQRCRRVRGKRCCAPAPPGPPDTANGAALCPGAPRPRAGRTGARGVSDGRRDVGRERRGCADPRPTWKMTTEHAADGSRRTI